MKTLLIALLLLLLVPFSVLAQNPTPAPTPDPEAIESNVGVHVETYTRVLHLTAGGNATEAGLRVPILPRWSLKASAIANPAANGGYEFGDVEFRERADHVSFLKGKAFLFPLNAIQFHAEVGFGRRRADGLKSEFAYRAEGGLSIAVGKIGGGTLVVEPGFGYLGSGPLNAPKTRFKYGSTGVADIGLALKF